MSKNNHLNKKLDLNIVSKYRQPIYGFAILWIVFFHGTAINNINYSFGCNSLKILRLFMISGNVGVDIFLFLSGICLYFSYHKNPNSYEFIKKRIFRVVLPVWIINGIYWFIVNVLINKQGIFSFINRMFLFHFWETGDQAIWFVSCILILYFIYPYIYQFLFNKENSNKVIIIRGLLLLLCTYLFIISFAKTNVSLYNTIEIALTRFPVFILGCIMGKFVFEDVKIPSYWKLISIIGTLLFFYVKYEKLLNGYYLRFFYLIGGVSLTYLLAILFSFIDKLIKKRKSYFLNILSIIGEFSLELYLSHITINQIYHMLPIYEKGNLYMYLIVIILSIILASLSHKICQLISKTINKNKDNHYDKIKRKNIKKV
ncbi:MAG: acyltransferase [Bacilli bacterium]